MENNIYNVFFYYWLFTVISFITQTNTTFTHTEMQFAKLYEINLYYLERGYGIKVSSNRYQLLFNYI